ncbi:MAG: sugar phosphate isomerase/epimerase [Trueperaceae bacterium]|nr:sugar phosphate isomerase/epimerase [Trueperaceae bacterium]
MKLSATSWSFPACTLSEISGILKALGIGAVDLGFFYASDIDKEKLLADPLSLAAALKIQGIDFANLYYLFGSSLPERNLASPEHRAENLADFKKAMQFCKVLAIPTVMLLPGLINKGQGRKEALLQTAENLNLLLPLAQEAGVTLTIEPHVHSYLESPGLVLELLERVPGLKLTLDYAHFVCLGYRQEEIDVLVPHAAHVHLRQARAGVLQAKLDEGSINFPALLATLKDVGYSGYLALEYVHQSYMNTLYDDVLTETVRMRDLVRAFL